MAVPVVLPRFNMEMEEATVHRWMVAEGQLVAEGDPLCEVETDKVNMEVEAPADGVVAGIRVAEGATVAINSVLAYIAADQAEAAGLQPGSAPSGVDQSSQDVAGGSHPSDRVVGVLPQIPSQVLGQATERHPEPAAGTPLRIQAPPAAKRMANERGLDLATLADADGRVTMAAVRAALAKASVSPPPAPTAGQALSATRRAIATRMLRSHSAPHITLHVEVRFRSLLELRAAWQGRRPSISAMLAAATCRALGQHRLLNSTFEDELLTMHPDVNLGVAVARPEGLIVPVLRHADGLGIDELNSRLGELVERARQARLDAQDTSGGTFTITSLGEAGVDLFAPLVNPPQVAILAVGRIADRVVPIAGGIGVESTAYLSLTSDHRVVDGHPGAMFLDCLKGLLEAPGWMVES